MRAIQQSFFPGGQPLFTREARAQWAVAVSARIAADRADMAFGAAHHVPTQGRGTAIPHPPGRQPLLERQRMVLSELLEVFLENRLDGGCHAYI